MRNRCEDRRLIKMDTRFHSCIKTLNTIPVQKSEVTSCHYLHRTGLESYYCLLRRNIYVFLTSISPNFTVNFQHHYLSNDRHISKKIYTSPSYSQLKENSPLPPTHPLKPRKSLDCLKGSWHFLANTAVLYVYSASLTH